MKLILYLCNVFNVSHEIKNTVNTTYETNMGPKWVLIWGLSGFLIWAPASFCKQFSDGTNIVVFFQHGSYMGPTSSLYCKINGSHMGPTCNFNMGLR